MIKAVLFDAGHTLLHAHPSVGEVYSQETAKLGASVTGEEFAGVFGPVFRAFVREYAAQQKSSDELDRAMWREIGRRVYERIAELRKVDFSLWFETVHRRFGDPDVWRLFPDAISTLTELRRRGYRLGIVSNWDTRLRGIAEGLGLTAMVDAVIISAEAGVRKPNPGIFELALERVGARPEESMHVGDLVEEDVEGARRAGVRPVLMDREGRATGQDVTVIRSLSELLTSLQTAS